MRSTEDLLKLLGTTNPKDVHLRREPITGVGLEAAAEIDEKLRSQTPFSAHHGNSYAIAVTEAEMLALHDLGAVPDELLRGLYGWAE